MSFNISSGGGVHNPKAAEFEVDSSVVWKANYRTMTVYLRIFILGGYEKPCSPKNWHYSDIGNFYT